MKTIDMYNKLVPLMDKIIKRGKGVDAFHSNYEGYGFYVELDSKYYINVHTWGDETSIAFCKRTGKFHHDIVNDIRIESKNVHTPEEVEVEVNRLINLHALNTEGDPKERLLTELVNFVGLSDSDREELSIQLSSIKGLIHDIKSSDSDITGLTSELVVQDLVDFLVEA